MFQLSFEDYSSLIELEQPYNRVYKQYNKIEKEDIVDQLLDVFLKESKEWKDVEIPLDYTQKRDTLRSLLNIREPLPVPTEAQGKLDFLLQMEQMEKGMVDVKQLPSISSIYTKVRFNQSNKLYLWQGDITQLNADVIVNAANKYMLGCFQPLHACIDNAIHSAAGPQLREDCNKIMSLQGELEETGGAKITRGYNLPAKYVLHTVGPIVPRGSDLTEKQKKELVSCYVSCLELANKKKDIKSLAFCAISTGVFGFPKLEAAEIAVNTVNEWLNNSNHHFDQIIFNVFSEDDYRIYQEVIQS